MAEWLTRRVAFPLIVLESFYFVSDPFVTMELTGVIYKRTIDYLGYSVTYMFTFSLSFHLQLLVHVGVSILLSIANSALFTSKA